MRGLRQEVSQVGFWYFFCLQFYLLFDKKYLFSCLLFFSQVAARISIFADQTLSTRPSGLKTHMNTHNNEKRRPNHIFFLTSSPKTNYTYAPPLLPNSISLWLPWVHPNFRCALQRKASFTHTRGHTSPCQPLRTCLCRGV